jgi:fumarate reductase (CoM/CoB) subunit A
MIEQFRDFAGVDILEDDMEVSPTAHHAMGGIRIDTDCSTNLEGLYAAGECTGGVHGGNRLGGNALADTQVFGAIAGRSAGQYALNHVLGPVDEQQVSEMLDRFWSPHKRTDGIRPSRLRNQLKDLMWEKVGIVRNGTLLREAVSELERMQDQLSSLYVADKGLRFNYELQEASAVCSMILVARIIAKCALYREESRGAHYREDFPETSKQWRKNIIFHNEAISTIPVPTR